MAVNSQTQTKRRLVFGGNVVLAVLIVWVLVVLVNFVADRAAPPAVDVTKSGKFSLSSRTTKLIENLEEPVVLTALYRVEEMDEQGEEQKRQVVDLLRRYAGVSGRVSYEVIDPLKDTAAKTRLLQRLIEKYGDEAGGHKGIVERFKEVGPQIVTLLDQEVKTINEAAQANPKINNNPNIVGIYVRFTRLLNDSRTLVEEIHELISGGDIPRYSDATKLIQDLYDGSKGTLDAAGKYLAEDGAAIEGLDEKTAEFFRGASERYQPLVGSLTEQLDEFTDLPKLELEELYDQVSARNAKTIVVEGPSKARVLPFNDVWQISRAPQGKDPTAPVNYDFNGEAAVSSAILALTAKERSAVVFVHAGPPSPIKPGFGGMRMIEPPFGAVKDKLEEANFVVEEWDMLASEAPPEIPDATRRVYVVLPPQPQQRQAPGMPPQGGYEPQHVERLSQILDEGGRAIFLVRFSPAMMTGQPYPFASMLQDKFGVKVDPDKLVIRVWNIRDQVIPRQEIELNRYESHQITEPVESLPSQFQMAVPITVAEKLPEHVTVDPLIRVGAGTDNVWAEENIFMLMQQGFTEKDEQDTKPPFDLAVEAENSETGAKVVVFGSAEFAINDVANQTQIVWMGNRFVQVLTNPANLELVANSAFWLNDNENLIAVGPRRSDVQRIGPISESGMIAWKVFFWVAWPLAALVAGGAVWLVRRK